MNGAVERTFSHQISTVDWTLHEEMGFDINIIATKGLGLNLLPRLAYDDEFSLCI